MLREDKRTDYILFRDSEMKSVELSLERYKGHMELRHWSFYVEELE